MGAFKLLAITGACSYEQNWSFVTSYLGPVSGVKPVYGEQIRGIYRASFSLKLVRHIGTSCHRLQTVWTRPTEPQGRFVGLISGS